MTTSTVRQEKAAGPGTINFLVGLVIVVALSFLARWFKGQVYGVQDLFGLGIPGKVLEYPIWAALVGLVANPILKGLKIFEDHPVPNEGLDWNGYYWVGGQQDSRVVRT